MARGAVFFLRRRYDESFAASFEVTKPPPADHPAAAAAAAAPRDAAAQERGQYDNAWAETTFTVHEVGQVFDEQGGADGSCESIVWGPEQAAADSGLGPDDFVVVSPCCAAEVQPLWRVCSN